MTKVLITGATGNVGMAVINALEKLPHKLDLYAGVRDLHEDVEKLGDYNINFSHFDVTDFNSYQTTLDDCDILFLLRPPQISEVEKYFQPLIDACVNKGVGHIVFLSVQGVEKSSIIPHNKIEKLILESKIPYTFLRPAYFMQNFTTTLRSDLIKNKQIYLPAGNAKFTLIDVSDIGEVAANILTNISLYKNKIYELTNEEKLTFSEMAEILSEVLDTHITFTSPNIISFFLRKKREGLPTMLILVMIMLHFFPRFQKEPEITECVKKITGKIPASFKQFINNNKKVLTDPMNRVKEK